MQHVYLANELNPAVYFVAGGCVKSFTVKSLIVSNGKKRPPSTIVNMAAGGGRLLKETV